jgi:hypothetical protein
MCQSNPLTFYNYIYWIQYAYGHGRNDSSSYNSYGLDTPSYYLISFYNVPFFERCFNCL